MSYDDLNKLTNKNILIMEEKILKELLEDHKIIIERTLSILDKYESIADKLIKDIDFNIDI